MDVPTAAADETGEDRLERLAVQLQASPRGTAKQQSGLRGSRGVRLCLPRCLEQSRGSKG